MLPAFQKGLLPPKAAKALLSPSMVSGDIRMRSQDSGREERACCHHEHWDACVSCSGATGLSQDWHLCHDCYLCAFHSSELSPW